MAHQLDVPLAGLWIAAEVNPQTSVLCDDKLSRACLNLDDEKGEKSDKAYPAHVT